MKSNQLIFSALCIMNGAQCYAKISGALDNVISAGAKQTDTLVKIMDDMAAIATKTIGSKGSGLGATADALTSTLKNPLIDRLKSTVNDPIAAKQYLSGFVDDSTVRAISKETVIKNPSTKALAQNSAALTLFDAKVVKDLDIPRTLKNNENALKIAFEVRVSKKIDTALTNPSDELYQAIVEAGTTGKTDNLVAQMGKISEETIVEEGGRIIQNSLRGPADIVTKNAAENIDNATSLADEALEEITRLEDSIDELNRQAQSEKYLAISTLNNELLIATRNKKGAIENLHDMYKRMAENPFEGPIKKGELTRIEQIEKMKKKISDADINIAKAKASLESGKKKLDEALLELEVVSAMLPENSTKNTIEEMVDTKNTSQAEKKLTSMKQEQATAVEKLRGKIQKLIPQQKQLPKNDLKLLAEEITNAINDGMTINQLEEVLKTLEYPTAIQDARQIWAAAVATPESTILAGIVSRGFAKYQEKASIAFTATRAADNTITISGGFLLPGTTTGGVIDKTAFGQFKAIETVCSLAETVPGKIKPAPKTIMIGYPGPGTKTSLQEALIEPGTITTLFTRRDINAKPQRYGTELRDWVAITTPSGWTFEVKAEWSGGVENYINGIRRSLIDPGQQEAEDLLVNLIRIGKGNNEISQKIIAELKKFDLGKTQLKNKTLQKIKETAQIIDATSAKFKKNVIVKDLGTATLKDGTMVDLGEVTFKDGKVLLNMGSTSSATLDNSKILVDIGSTRFQDGTVTSLGSVTFADGTLVELGSATFKEGEIVLSLGSAKFKDGTIASLGSVTLEGDTLVKQSSLTATLNDKEIALSNTISAIKDPTTFTDADLINIKIAYSEWEQANQQVFDAVAKADPHLAQELRINFNSLTAQQLFPDLYINTMNFDAALAMINKDHITQLVAAAKNKVFNFNSLTSQDKDILYKLLDSATK